ncbi:MAG: SOS response-associated peptidase [Acidimicrobiales bacterium]
MCGRIVVYRPADVLAALFDAMEAPGLGESFAPSFNLAPTRTVAGLVVTARGPRVLCPFRWGLRNRLFNARAETAATSRTFAPALRARRLAVLADGFFEWRAGDGGPSQPLYFHRADGEPLALAGLWEREEEVVSCTVMTTAAGEDLAGVHDRMPVVLERNALAAWLGPGELRALRRDAILEPSPAGTLVHHAVDPRVGDVRNDSSDLIDPFDPPAPPLRLFG